VNFKSGTAETGLETGSLAASVRHRSIRLVEVSFKSDAASLFQLEKSIENERERSRVTATRRSKYNWSLPHSINPRVYRRINHLHLVIALPPSSAPLSLPLLCDSAPAENTRRAFPTV